MDGTQRKLAELTEPLLARKGLELVDLEVSRQRGTAYGTYNAIIGLAALPASLMAGVLWQAVSPAAPFVLSATLALLAAVLLMLGMR